MAGGDGVTDLIRSDFLLMALRSELAEQRFVRKLWDGRPEHSDVELARLDGFIEALEWARDQIELRTRKAA